MLTPVLSRDVQTFRYMRLSDFRVLTFDCYGTLIDWETGIFAALQPLLRRTAKPSSRNSVLESFAQHEAALEEANPGMIYSTLLAEVHRRLAEEWKIPVLDEDHARFGVSVPVWPAFPDTPAALQYLKRHYKLVILSNVDRKSFRGSNERLGVAFDAIYTAEDIGSYKPNPRNFRYLLDRIAEEGYHKEEILHTAQSLYHDHAPAKRFGLATAWIDRRQGQTGFGATMPPPENASYDFRFESLAEMAEEHKKVVS